MAIKDIVARGIGFSPASVKFIVTHGFIAGAAVAATVAGRPGRKRRYILPNGMRVTATPEEFERIRARFEQPAPMEVVLEPVTEPIQPQEPAPTLIVEPRLLELVEASEPLGVPFLQQPLLRRPMEDLSDAVARAAAVQDEEEALLALLLN